MKKSAQRIEQELFELNILKQKFKNIVLKGKFEDIFLKMKENI